MSKIDMGAMHIEFHCSSCGGANVTVPDDESEGPWITCSACHEQLITVGQFNAEVKRVGKEIVASAVTGERISAKFKHPALKLGKIE